jgi:hypothetical protein
MNTIQDAEKAIKRKFAEEGPNGLSGQLRYEASKVIENERWWYIPCGWIGCSGCIVNKHDLYVNWLGSSLSQTDYFWGHDNGIFYDLVDFSFAPNTDRELAAKLLLRFQHMHPDARGVHPKEPVWYLERDIPSALASQFPMFRRHFVWFAIPEIRKASKTNDLRFTSVLSDRA